jgi:hypothetical protein
MFNLNRDPLTGLILVATILFPAAPANAAERGAPGQAQPRPADVASLKPADTARFADYIRKNGKAPGDYILEKFTDHDVVMLGEMHEIKEYLRLYADLIEPSYHEAGVRVLAIEILKSKHNERLKELVTADTYDREGVLDVFRDEFRGTWGFKEYVDLVEAVWRLNSTLPPDAEKFIVVGLSADVDILRPESIDGQANEQNAADVIAREVLDAGKKALVPIGYNHTFLAYRQSAPKGGPSGLFYPRFGFILYEKYGDRVFQVCLHQDHPYGGASAARQRGLRPVLGGLAERAFKAAGGRPVGFDVVGSPFANLRDGRSYYFAGRSEVVFSDIARGYVIIKPVKELDKRCTWVDGFIADVNFAKARAFALERGWIKPNQCKTPAELDARFKMIFESK